MVDSSYMAWDGKRYDGEPPAGWYLAHDKRWWPEGYAPSSTKADDVTTESAAIEEPAKSLEASPSTTASTTDNRASNDPAPASSASPQGDTPDSDQLSGPSTEVSGAGSEVNPGRQSATSGGEPKTNISDGVEPGQRSSAAQNADTGASEKAPAASPGDVPPKKDTPDVGVSAPRAPDTVVPNVDVPAVTVPRVSVAPPSAANGETLKTDVANRAVPNADAETPRADPASTGSPDVDPAGDVTSQFETVPAPGANSIRPDASSLEFNAAAPVKPAASNGHDFAPKAPAAAVQFPDVNVPPGPSPETTSINQVPPEVIPTQNKAPNTATPQAEMPQTEATEKFAPQQEATATGFLAVSADSRPNPFSSEAAQGPKMVQSEVGSTANFDAFVSEPAEKKRKKKKGKSILVGFLALILLSLIAVAAYFFVQNRNNDDANASSETVDQTSENRGSFNNPQGFDEALSIFYEDDKSALTFRWVVQVAANGAEPTDVETKSGEVVQAATVIIEYQEGEDEVPLNRLVFSSIGQDLERADPGEQCLTELENGLDLTQTLSPGDTAEGRICWSVPEASTADRRLAVSSPEALGSIYFKLS